jgi:RHS repeat-associated protein
MATVTGGVTSVSHFGWCGQTLCQSRGATDAPLRRYLAEGEYDAVQGALIYAPDHPGSVRDVLAGGSAQSLGHFDYDPYGNATAATGSRANWPDFRYAGLFYHPTSGLYLATYRAYDPAIARWLSRDPIEEQGGRNLYAYVGGSAVGRTDPNGLSVMQIGVSVGGGGGAVSGSYEVGIAFDFHGNVGTYDTAAIVAGVAGEAGVSATATISPGADNISELAGSSATVSGSGGEGVIVGVNYSTPFDGGPAGYGFSLGFGSGATAGVGGSHTAISPLFGPQPFVPADPCPGLTQALQSGLGDAFLP